MSHSTNKIITRYFINNYHKYIATIYNWWNKENDNLYEFLEFITPKASTKKKKKFWMLFYSWHLSHTFLDFPVWDASYISIAVILLGYPKTSAANIIVPRHRLIRPIHPLCNVHTTSHPSTPSGSINKLCSRDIYRLPSFFVCTFPVSFDKVRA